MDRRQRHAMGSTLVFAEGAPDWPADRLAEADRVGAVTVLGISPTLTRALIPHGEPATDLSSLARSSRPASPGIQAVSLALRGGRRRPVSDHQLLRRDRGRRLLPLADGAIPIKACSLGGPALGMAMDVVDAEGNSVPEEVGELVCRKPFPGMTRGFWRDPERYLDTYWRRFPGIWTHGDWASVDEDGYWFLHGRSDDTLNIAGKRVGPAELESAAVGHPASPRRRRSGSARGEGRGRVDLLRAHPGHDASEELATEVSAAVAAELGKAFARRVIFVIGAAEDAQREDRSPRRAGPALGNRSRATCPRSRTPSRWRRSPMPSELSGVALVTGGGRGIGANMPASSPPTAGTSSSPLGLAIRSRRSPRRSAAALEADVTDREAVERVVAEAGSGVELLVANAGIGAMTVRPGRSTRRSGGACWR